MVKENEDELKRKLLEVEERERVKAERERLEKERIESERAAMERERRAKEERERLEKERIESERAAMERERVERERFERERFEREKKEMERVDALVAERMEAVMKKLEEDLARYNRERERSEVERIEALVKQRLEFIEEERIKTLERERMETNQGTAIGKLKSLINSWLGSQTGGTAPDPLPQEDVGSFEAILVEVRKVGDSIKRMIPMAAVFAVLGTSCDYVVQQGSSNFKDDSPGRLAMILHGSALCAILFGLAKLERSSWTAQSLVYLGVFVSGIATTFRFFCHF